MLTFPQAIVLFTSGLDQCNVCALTNGANQYNTNIVKAKFLLTVH